MVVSRAAVLAKGSEWIEMLEQPDGSNNIEFSRDWGIVGQSWCFAFVQSCFWYADPNQTASHSAGALPHQSMYCPYGIQWARDNGQSVEAGDAPIAGDIVFFSWDMANWGRWTPGTGDHVGVVESWDGGDIINTIEGNVGPRDGVSNPQGVWRRRRSISGQVVCFWRPAVYDDSLAPASIPEEEDVTPEQAQMLGETRNYAGGAFDQALAANKRLDDIRNYVGGAFDQAAAANSRLDGLSAQVEALAHGGGGSEPAIDVEASLQQATPAQLAALGGVKLLAAVNELLTTQPKPPVPHPADADQPAEPAVG